MLNILEYRPLTQKEISKNQKQLDFYKKINDYFEENYLSVIRLSEVAQTFGYSVGYFARYFHSLLNMTLNDYLIEFRVSKAVDLLCNTDFSIEEIAEKSGFGNVRNFHRNFKQIKKVSPSVFRHNFIDSLN